MAAQPTGLSQPVSVYVNWAAYDELSDTVRLTEALAMQQLEHLVRLKKRGARFDYYLMDAFWFQKNGALRQWRQRDWPEGYERWLKVCKDNHIKPGLWFPVNYLYPAGQYILDAPEQWKSSLSKDGKGLCLFDGEYLQDFMQVLSHYADKGFRLFKFDFFDMNAVTPRLQDKMTPAEIRQANFSALRKALQQFRQDHPEVLLIAYNGFGGEMSNTGVPVKQTVKKEWLDVFHTLYCGDPRPADVPAVNFWRSKDIYSDHMVRYFEANGFSLRAIDNAGFMIGSTGTCYYRGKAAWKGMLLLSLARGGWMNTYYGDFSLLNEDDGRWFAKAQQLFYPLQQANTTSTFGSLPGKGKPYGYLARTKAGEVVTVVNPSQQHATIELPVSASGKSRLLFADAGFRPLLQQQKITLGPEQMAVVGFGKFASATYELQAGDDVLIPLATTPVPALFQQEGATLKGKFVPTKPKSIRLLFQQMDSQGIPVRTTGGSPPDGISLEKLLTISATQGGKPLPLRIAYDKAIWSGLSWAAAEIEADDFSLHTPVEVQFSTQEKDPLQLTGKVFYVDYPLKKKNKIAKLTPYKQ